LFRFLFVRQRTALDLSLAVPALAHWRQAGLPQFLEPTKVQAILQSCDRRTALGRRDYAMLLLLARMGLRSGEVVTLDIDDVNWRAGEITIHGKGARLDVLPLPDDVGNALAKHLTRGSGRKDGRAVFLGCRAPFHRLSRSAVVVIVHKACRRSGQPEVSPHRLRHSAATMMLRGGASLSEIGQVLRHRLDDTTAIYAKVDIGQLREVARPWAGGDR
jgi:site-specific recombinase XerD